MIIEFYRIFIKIIEFLFVFCHPEVIQFLSTPIIWESTVFEEYVQKKKYLNYFYNHFGAFTVIYACSGYIS